MSTQIVPFEFGGEQIRVEMIDGEPWFVAQDIAVILEYSATSAMTRRLSEDDKGVRDLHTPGGEQSFTIISEAGLYVAIFGSQAAGAQQFKRKVTHEILPQIRKTGSYSKPLTLAERSLALLSELSDEVQRQQAELVEIRPLATQARTFNKRKGNTGRQEFARSVVSWALGEGYKVTANQVHEFVGVKLDLFVFGKYRTDRGIATLSGVRRGLTDTDKGVDPRNGHSYEQGFYTPKGVEYAWSRIEEYITTNGHLELPKKGIAA